MRITLNIENRIDYYANTPGTTRLQIRDSAGRSVNITVTITAPRNLVISTSSVSIQNGNTTTFTIKDGNGGYTTTSNNTSIATVSLNGTTATITARAVGSTTITVRDRLGRQINLPVTITAKPLTLDKTSITIDEKTSGYINITNGNGGYSVTRNNANVSVHPNGSTGYRVYGEKVGSSILNIKDSAGKVVSVSVVVRENIKNLVVTGFNQSRNGVEGEIINFTTTSGNGNYTITSSNTNVASVSINSTLGNGSITLKTPGSTTITLKDGKAKSVSMNIGVLPILKNIEYTSQVEDGYLGGMYYEVENNNLIKETGIEYRYLDSSNRVTKQGLQNIPKNTDVNERSYAAFIVPNCNSACVIEVRAYVKTASNVTIYKNNGVWGKINYGVKLLTSASTLKVANNEEEDVFSGETDDRKEEEEYIEDDIAGYEERVDRENSGESIESEYSEEKEETYEEEYSEEEEGVEVNFFPAIIIVARIILVGIELYDTYQTINECNNDGYLTTSCLVELGQTITPVKKGKSVLNILGFNGKKSKFGDKILKLTKKENRYLSKVDIGGSKTLGYTKDSKYRVDIETVNGVGGVHVQDMNNNKIKYFYNYQKKGFYSDNGEKAPNSIQKLLDDSNIQKSLEKAKDYISINNYIGN